MSENSTLLVRPTSPDPAGLARYVRECLALAKDSRAHIFMDFLLNGRVVYQLKGGILELEERRFSVYLRGEDLEYLPSVGMNAHLYFSLRLNHNLFPYDFTAVLRETARINNDVLLYFSLPEDLGHNQRRNNVRVAVNKNDIGNFKVWFGRSLPAGNGQKMRWMPFETEQTDLIDISAGGIQLLVDRDSELAPLLSTKEVLLTNGIFETRGKDKVSLMLAGNIIRVTEEDRQSHLQLGISFRQWAKMNPDGLQWLKTSPEEGVVPLASWVFQMIMERYRNNKAG